MESLCIFTTPSIKQLSPAFFVQQRLVAGTITNQSDEIRWISGSSHRDFKLEDRNEIENRRNILINYPFAAYIGPLSDSREFVIANLADKERPQMIVQLPEQILCFS